MILAEYFGLITENLQIIWTDNLNKDSFFQEYYSLARYDLWINICIAI